MNEYYFFFFLFLSASLRAFSLSLSRLISSFTLSINFCPRMSLSMIRLLVSNNILEGKVWMLWSFTSLLFHPVKSHSCNHWVVSRSEAANHASLSKSSERLITWNYSFFSAFSTGIKESWAATLSLSQLAQKSISMYLFLILAQCRF